MGSSSSASSLALADLHAVNARLNYLAPGEGPVEVRAYAPGSGIAGVVPPSAPHWVAIRDARPLAKRFELDTQGFELHARRSAFASYYEAALVQKQYYPEVRDVMRELTGAIEVIVFDHNVRSSARAARRESGVLEPVAQVHNDYTVTSGPRRKQQILTTAGRTDLAGHHVAFVNLWRPIIGPVQDNPLAVCDARSVAPADLIATSIQHFGEGDTNVPRHRGEIYSVRHAPAHCWYYFSEMQPEELLLLKGYDSREEGRARFVPHTGFEHPAPPSQYVPRESIEARTLLVFEETL